MKHKPKVDRLIIAFLDDCNRSIQQMTTADAQSLRSVASDVADGWLLFNELQPLFRARMLRKVPLGPFDLPPGRDNKMCGASSTVEFTDRALRHFWPGRFEKRATP